MNRNNRDESRHSARFNARRRPRFYMLLSLGSVVFYTVLFLLTVGKLGRGVGAMATVPVVVIGYCYGMTAGMTAGILTIPVNGMLLSAAGMAGWDIVMGVRGLLSHSVFLIIGATVGRLRDLGERVKRELAERKRLEEQLIQSHKMEAIGRLAGSIAHDFNNLLTVINGHTEIMMKEMQPRHSMYENLTEIMLAGDQAALLTRQLLAFSRRQCLEAKELDLGALAGDMQPILQALAGPGIELKMARAPASGPVSADPVQMQQVLMNLTVNAREAMPDGGVLTIETAPVDVDEAFARRHGIGRPGRYIRLTARDTGVGMDEETQVHIFEPFFTTREAGQGTGLGLSTVFGIVTQSRGFIECASEPGRGTTFHLYLPEVAPSSKTAHADPVRVE